MSRFLLLPKNLSHIQFTGFGASHWKWKVRTGCALIMMAIATPLFAQFEALPNAAPHSTAANKPSNITRRSRHWWERRAPAKATAPEQLDYADQLLAEDRLSAAARHYRILTFAWPNSSEAPIAQFKYAEILQRREKYQKAFDEYQYLLDAYAGFCAYDAVLEQQYIIANTIATRHKRVLFVAYQDEEEAIPMFEQLIINAPSWHRAAELQFRIARIYEKNKQYDLALDAYAAFQRRFPFSTLLETAFFSELRCWYLYAQKKPNDANIRHGAISAQRVYLNAYPHSAKKDVVQAQLQELLLEEAGFLYQQARLYDNMSRHTKVPAEINTMLIAAKTSYERLRQEFPDSRWSDMAAVRINLIERRQAELAEKL